MEKSLSVLRQFRGKSGRLIVIGNAMFFVFSIGLLYKVKTED